MTKSEQDTLINTLRNGPPGKFEILPLIGDAGANHYLGQVAYAFVQASWTPYNPKNEFGIICGDPNWDCYGLEIWVKDRDGKYTKPVVDALLALVPRSYVKVEPSRNEGEIAIYVGKFPFMPQ